MKPFRSFPQFPGPSPRPSCLRRVGVAVALTLAAAAGAEERVVKGAPYCAEAVHETVQWLADPAGGAPNRITRTQVSRLCRDGEGRLRQEVDRSGRKRVFLRDPVAGQNWMLDPERKTATALPMHAGDWARDLAARALEAAERARAAAGPTSPVPRAPPMPPVPVIISRSEDALLRLESLSAATGPRVEFVAEGLFGGLGGPVPGGAPRGPGVHNPLPAREIEGLRVSGERTTWQIEAGQVGNERPIVIVREVWSSPELMLTVASRDFDPRVGEVSYRLRGVQRGEPDAALFRVPADFQRSR